MASQKGVPRKDACLHCGESLRPRQEALACDECSRWQHGLCETFEWQCLQNLFTRVPQVQIDVIPMHATTYHIHPVPFFNYTHCSIGEMLNFTTPCSRTKTNSILMVYLHENVYLYDSILRLYYIIPCLCCLPSIVCCAFTYFPHLNSILFNDPTTAPNRIIYNSPHPSSASNRISYCTTSSPRMYMDISTSAPDKSITAPMPRISSHVRVHVVEPDINVIEVSTA